jgi:hypothetical protein
VNQERVSEIFAQALEKPSPEERRSFLMQACASEPELRQKVQSLVAADDKANGFMSAQAVPVAPHSLLVEKCGDRIGRYKLLGQIGEGGFGVVWMAEQEEPVRRRVALKIIKLGMDTKEVLARFEAERQALAMMEHPNIASVFDGGATDTGRPYFVMGLVRRGAPSVFPCFTSSSSSRSIRCCFELANLIRVARIDRSQKP